MENDGRQRGLLEQYLHLAKKRQASSTGQNSRARQKSTPGTAKRTVQGTIRRLMLDRGFGFVQAEGQKQDLFFHRSSVQKVAFEDLKEGDYVEFDVQRDELRDRNSAINIRLATRPKLGTSPKAEPSRGRIFTGWQSFSTRSDRTNRRRDSSERGPRSASEPDRSRQNGSG